MTNGFLLLLETILFSINLDEPESELENYSLAYLIFKWYQAQYLYNVLTNPNYQKEELFGGRYWIVHNIKQSIPRLEKYIKKIGKLIYKKSKPIFLDWADTHDAEHFERMMNERVNEIEADRGNLYDFVEDILSYTRMRRELSDFLKNLLEEEGRIYPFDSLPQAADVITKKLKEFFIDCGIKEMLEDHSEYLEDELDFAKEEGDEEEIERLSDELNDVKDYLNKPEKEWTMHDIYDVLQYYILGIFPTIFDWFMEKGHITHACQRDIVWFYILYYLEMYFLGKGYNELPQWIDKVRQIRELFKYDQPPDDLKELTFLTEKIIHFTHNNGHLLADHMDKYDEDLSRKESAKIEHIIGKKLYDLVDLLDYFATNEYKDPELAKTLEKYKNYYVPQERKENENKLK